MPEIVPAIIAKSFDELKEKISAVEAQVKTVQLDVMDGIFVPNKTWASPRDLEKLDTQLFLEAHLMIDTPHRVLNEWLASKVRRIILHWEVIEKIHNHELLPYKTQVDQYFPVGNLAEEIHRCGKEFGLALNPKTPITVLGNFISKLDMVLLMSVEPGAAGQEFIPAVIPKIIALRQANQNVKIGVDGGVSLVNARELKEAGADFLVVGSGIFSNENPSQAISQLKEAIK